MSCLGRIRSEFCTRRSQPKRPLRAPKDPQGRERPPTSLPRPANPLHGLPAGALLALFKLAYEQGQEVWDRLFGQVLIEPPQAEPEPGKNIGVHRRAVGAALQP